MGALRLAATLAKAMMYLALGILWLVGLAQKHISNEEDADDGNDTDPIEIDTGDDGE